jgi:endo-1,4-beta-xylanase
MPTRRFSRRQFAVTAGVGLLAAARARAFRQAAADTGLKDAFRGTFLIGTVDGRTVNDPTTPLARLVAREFDAITPTNMMKWGPIEPREGEWQWAGPDRLVDFGTAHKMTVVGHTLVWHSQTPSWLFVDGEAPVSKAKLLQRIETRIRTLVGRYRGRVHVWDVVNEAIDEDEKGWRRSPFYTIAGPEYVELAFRLAHEVDPQATLLYNDYNEHNPGRRRFLVDVIKDYRKRSVPIHGVGFQGHVGLEYPDLAEYEKSLQAMAAEGVPVHVTELDVDVLPRASGYTGAEISTNYELRESLDPWKTGLPPEIDAKLTARYRQMFALFLKYRTTVARVSTWGTHDGESWKNNFPVRGRTNYPLLFDRALRPKAAHAALIALARPG